MYIYIYSSFNVFLYIHKHFYCRCMYYCLKDIDPLCCVYKQTNSFLSFCSPIFLSKIHKRRERFLSGEVNSLKRTYVEDGT